METFSHSLSKAEVFCNRRVVDQAVLQVVKIALLMDSSPTVHYIILYVE